MNHIACFPQLKRFSITVSVSTRKPSRLQSINSQGRFSDSFHLSRLPDSNPISGKECEIQTSEGVELTATGIVPVSHRIPFSPSVTHLWYIKAPCCLQKYCFLL